MWLLYRGSNQSSRALSTHTVGEAPARSPNPRKCGDEESYGKVRGAREKGAMVFVKCLGFCKKTRWRAPCGGKP